MEGKENQQPEPITYGEYLQEVKPDQLNIGDFVNVETESCSRYIFKIIAIEGDRVYVEYCSGTGGLFRDIDTEDKVPTGYIRSSSIKRERIFKLNIEGKKLNTTEIASLIITQGAPYDYLPVSPLYAEETGLLEVSQYESGDHVYVITEDNHITVFKFIDPFAEKPLVELVASTFPHATPSTVGNFSFSRYVAGMRLRNSIQKMVFPARSFVVTPDFDQEWYTYLQEENPQDMIPLDVELEEVFFPYLKPGHILEIESGSVYRIYVYHSATGAQRICVVGGDNQFVGETGAFETKTIAVGEKFLSSVANTRAVKRLMVTRKVADDKEFKMIEEILSYTGGFEPVKGTQIFQREQLLNIAIPSTFTKLEIFHVLDLQGKPLALETLRKKWQVYCDENIPQPGDEDEEEYNRRFRFYEGLEDQFKWLCEKLEETRKLWEE